MRMSLATKFSLKPFAKPNSGLAATESNSAATQTSLGPSNSSSESSTANASCVHDATPASLFPQTASRSSNQVDLIGTSFAAKQAHAMPEPRQNDKPSLSPTPSRFQPQGFGQGHLFGAQEEGQSDSLRLAPLPTTKMFGAPSMTHANTSSSQQQLGSSGTPMESTRSSTFPITPTNSIANEIRSRASTMTAASNNNSSNNNNERSLVLLSQQANGGYGSTSMSQEDPFAEVTRTIHFQNRKIRELELQLKEQATISDQLRSRIDDSQEDLKKAEDELALLRDKVARSENTSTHKDVEMNELRTRISQLEADKFRMMNENSVLSKTIEDQKKHFIAELKKSTETILVLQNIRGKTSAPAAGIPNNTPEEMMIQKEKDTEEKISEIQQPNMFNQHAEATDKHPKEDANQPSTIHENMCDGEDKLKTNMLEQALMEAENNFEDLKRWYSIAAGIIGQCESCSLKFNHEQDIMQEDAEQQPKVETTDQIQPDVKMEIETKA